MAPITPRYGDDPVIVLDADPTAIRVPLLRQRRRLLATLETLADEQWAAPSRCDEWTVQGVVTHLVSTDGFWGASLALGLKGEPSRFLAGFDPKATPARDVADHGKVDPAQTLSRFRDITLAFCATVNELEDEGFTVIGEAPPGHVAMSTVLHHALWDCWVHERDITVPLGLATAPEDDEVLAALQYATALSPAFSVGASGSGITGDLGIEVTDPDAIFHVGVDGRRVRVSRSPAPAGAPRLAGEAVRILEGLSHRLPLDHALTPDERWMVDGLTEVFS